VNRKGKFAVTRSTAQPNTRYWRRFGRKRRENVISADESSLADPFMTERKSTAKNSAIFHRGI